MTARLLGGSATLLVPFGASVQSRLGRLQHGQCKSGECEKEHRPLRGLCRHHEAKSVVGRVASCFSLLGSRSVSCEVTSSNNTPKHVVCIGAGAAGLCCAKELLEKGFQVTVLESRDGVGGVWRFNNGSVPGMRKKQYATSSKYYLGFSDFPIAEEEEDFVSNEAYIKYLESYADHFDVKKRIRFQNKVNSVQHAGSGWTVEVTTPCGTDILECDAIAVCAGLHGKHVLPEPPGEFSGRKAHAAEVKDFDMFGIGRTTVVVGGGEMGAELAHAAATAGKGILSLRRGITCIGQYYPLPLAGRMHDIREAPLDLGYPRIFNMLSEKWRSFIFTNSSGIYELRDDNPAKHSPMRLAAASLGAVKGVVTGLLVAISALGGIFREAYLGFSNASFWDPATVPFRTPDGGQLSMQMRDVHAGIARQSLPIQRDSGQLNAYMARAADFRMRGFTEAHYREVRSLLEEYSGAQHCSNFLTKSDDFIYDILDARLEVRPGIKYFQERSVVFDDGSAVEADLVVFCTGYEPHLPFLSPQLHLPCGPTGVLDPTGLYKRVFPPALQGIGFIGFARPQLGAMPPIAELQARWFAAVLAGDAQLPELEQMQAAISAESEAYNTKVFAGRLRASVNFGLYTAELAQHAGCYPDIGFSTFFSDNALWRAFWLGPCLPQAFRIGDASERGERARSYLKRTYEAFGPR